MKYIRFQTTTSGHRFILYPILDVDSEDSVKEAINEIRRFFKVRSIQVRWINKKDSLSQPEKIPDYIVIQNLQKEIGQLKSYIQELQFKLSEKERVHSRLTTEEKRSIKRESMYQAQAERTKSLERQIKLLRKDKEDLIIRLAQYQKE